MTRDEPARDKVVHLETPAHMRLHKPIWLVPDPLREAVGRLGRLPADEAELADA